MSNSSAAPSRRLPTLARQVGTDIARGNQRRIKKRSRYEGKSNALLRSRSRHGRDSGVGRKGRSDPRYLHGERRHSVEARRSQAPWTGDVRGVGESKRGRLVDPAKVSRGTVHLAASSALRFLISAKPPIFISQCQTAPTPQLCNFIGNHESNTRSVTEEAVGSRL
jgi:hypothetical protein